MSTFDPTKKEWCCLGEMRLEIEETEFSRGGMRHAFKGVVVKENSHPMLSDFKVNSTVVMKAYIDDVVKAANEKGRQLCAIARKEIQTQMVVRNIAEEFAKTYAGFIDQFPRVLPAFMASSENGEEIYMMEECLPGEFKKYMNNDGTSTLHASSCVEGRVCMAFAHWSLCFGQGQILVTDLQGVDMQLTDVELATTSKGYYGIGNVGTDAISNFRKTHQCTDICVTLKLHKTYDLTKENQPPKSLFFLG